jgi:peptidoglycan-associated lipoprotein
VTANSTPTSVVTLVGIGIPSAQLSLISYGKERPVCQEQDEACWQRNRRIHIVATAQAQK